VKITHLPHPFVIHHWTPETRGVAPFTPALQRQYQSYHTSPGIERVQGLTDILRSALCCHSNETRAPIANLPNSAQRAPPTISPTYIWVRAVVWECGEGQTDTRTHTRTCPIHISPRLCLTRNV